MTAWIQATPENLPDDLVTVWISDGKTVGISEYHHGLQEWLYCEVVLGPITCWLPIEYPETPKP